MTSLRDALALTSELLLGFYAICLVLCFLLQRADGLLHNPISLFLFTITGPVLRPLRRVLPSVRGYDLSCLLLLALLKSGEAALLSYLHGHPAPSTQQLLLYAPASILELFINVFLICIFMLVLLSWINPSARHQGAYFIRALAELLLRPLRRFTPKFPGINLSPLLAVAVLLLAKLLVVAPLYQMAGGRLF